MLDSPVLCSLSNRLSRDGRERPENPDWEPDLTPSRVTEAIQGGQRQHVPAVHVGLFYPQTVDTAGHSITSWRSPAHTVGA